MDPILYEAVVKGEVDVVSQNADRLEVQLTPNSNTVLHVAALFGQTEVVKELLRKCGESLIRRVNIRGETPLPISAREGHAEVAQALIDYAKKAQDEEDQVERGIAGRDLLRMTTAVGDTALHEAVRNNHLALVDMLTKEDPRFLHPSNGDLETPLFLAAERFYPRIVSSILNNCRSPAYTGPQSTTALHAAATWSQTDCLEALLKWRSGLTKEADERGWTALHLAARVGSASSVGRLLEADRSMARHAAEEDGRRTALHIAASRGHVAVMEKILSHCPDCWEMMTSSGQNILHVAVEYEQPDAIGFILGRARLSSLINQKDADGNTPLHLYAAARDVLYSRLAAHPRLDNMAFNKNHLNPLDAISCSDLYTDWGDVNIKKLKNCGATRGWRNISRRDEEEREEASKWRAQDRKRIPLKELKLWETELVVATLIATVTFAAGFTVPGGYNGSEGSERGMPILIRKAAFKAFLVTDTIALVFSVTAMLLHVTAGRYFDQYPRTDRYVAARLLTLGAMVAMLVAIMTGLYVVSAEYSLALALALCLICCTFPLSHIMLKKVRYGISKLF